MHFIFFWLIGSCYCAPINIDNNIIPFIIGISLMALILVILLITLMVCFCMKQDKQLVKCSNNSINSKPEEVLLIEYKDRRASILSETVTDPETENTITEKKPEVKMGRTEFEKAVAISKFDITLAGRSFQYIPKTNQFRRASVPTVLSVLHEASPSLENSRKMSLSYNCVSESRRNSKSSTKDIVDNGLVIPPNELLTEHSSKKESSECLVKEKPNRYSIYHDESISPLDICSRYGKIVFSLQYNVDDKTLEVTMKKAKYLIGQRVKGKNHFYVKLRLRKPNQIQFVSTNSLSGVPEKVTNKELKSLKGTFRTAIKTDFCNPEFEETFKFTNVTPKVLRDYNLQFIVKEETPRFLEKNKVIGQVSLVLKDAQLIEKHESISELVRDIYPLEDIGSKGYAAISLYYSRLLGILSMSILEVTSTDNLTDVSIDIYLRSIDNVIISKKIDLDENLKSSAISEFLVDNCFLNSFCLVVLFFARIRNCSRSNFGRIIIGPIYFSDGLGLIHWSQMSIGDKTIVKTHEIL